MGRCVGRYVGRCEGWCGFGGWGSVCEAGCGPVGLVESLVRPGEGCLVLVWVRNKGLRGAAMAGRKHRGLHRGSRGCPRSWSLRHPPQGAALGGPRCRLSAGDLHSVLWWDPRLSASHLVPTWLLKKNRLSALKSSG